MIFLQLLFVALMVTDCITTYKCIKSGKGKEAAFAKLYIKNKPLTIIVTAIGTLLILLLINLSGFYLLLIPVDLFIGWVCFKTWRLSNG